MSHRDDERLRELGRRAASGDLAAALEWLDADEDTNGPRPAPADARFLMERRERQASDAGRRATLPFGDAWVYVGMTESLETELKVHSDGDWPFLARWPDVGEGGSATLYFVRTDERNARTSGEPFVLVEYDLGNMASAQGSVGEIGSFGLHGGPRWRFQGPRESAYARRPRGAPRTGFGRVLEAATTRAVNKWAGDHRAEIASSARRVLNILIAAARDRLRVAEEAAREARLELAMRAAKDAELAAQGGSDPRA